MPLLPLGFAVVFTQVILETLVCVFVFEIDGEEEGAAGQGDRVRQFADDVVVLDPQGGGRPTRTA